VKPLVVQLLDVPARPWRNGGGVTRELLAAPAGEAWQVRISVADIDADGPFSRYTGVERWFTVLQGHGVELTIDGTMHRLVRGDLPLRFDGAAAARARLIDGPTRDLNLMSRGAGGTMRCAADGDVWVPPAECPCGLFSAVAGRCQTDHHLPAIEVPAFALLWFDAAPASLTFSAGQAPVGPIGWWLAAPPQEA
jgi:hypothetical protein